MTEHPGSDPIEILIRWHAEAIARGAVSADAMALATGTPDGHPSVRVILYKGVVKGRIRFVTNFGSRKGRDIEENPRVALAFHWPELERQLRIEGSASRGSIAESDDYFRSRPRESQLGAWASPQSEPIESREILEQRYEAAEERFRGRAVERPEHWGVYWVEPERIELWMAAAHRLHDRFSYVRNASGWSVTRLAP